MAIPMDRRNAALEQIERRRLRDLEIIAAEEAQAGVVPQVSVAPLPTYTSGMMGPEYADLAPDKGMIRSYSPPPDFNRWPTPAAQPEESLVQPPSGISPYNGDSSDGSRPPYADLATYLGLGILGENVPRRDRPPSLTGGIAAGGRAYLEARQAQQNKGPMTKGNLWQLPDGRVIPAAVMNGVPHLDLGGGDYRPHSQVPGAKPFAQVIENRRQTGEDRRQEEGDRSHRIALAARNNDFSGQSRIYTHEDVEDVTFFRTFLETEKDYEAGDFPIHDSVNDINLMYAYEAALNPHTRKVTNADTQIVKKINSVIQNVGFAIQGIYEGSFSMPDETRDMMRLFVQKSSDGRIKKMKDEVLPLTLQAWRSDPRWTPPGIVIRLSEVGTTGVMEPWWQWPDGSTVNMTNFYKTHGGTVVPTWDGYTE
jgi:hypothetical protein